MGMDENEEEAGERNRGEEAVLMPIDGLQRSFLVRDTCCSREGTSLSVARIWARAVPGSPDSSIW
jgi:hypothetical protein